MSDTAATPEAQAASAAAAYAELVSGLFHGYVSKWTDTRVRHILNTLTDPSEPGGVTEADVTAILEALEDGAEELMRLVWSKVGGTRDDLPDGAALYSLAEFLGNSTWKKPGVPRDKEPDLVIAHPDPADHTTPAHERRLLPLVFCEVKGNADINGGLGHCGDFPARYSNQVICYPHGCWLNLEGRNGTDFRLAKFAWIGPDHHVSTPNRPWGRRGLVNADLTRDRDPDLTQALAAAFAVQSTLVGSWHPVPFSQVEQALRDAEGPGAAVAADVIESWLTRLGLHHTQRPR